MLRRCGCGNVFDPEQAIHVKVLGGNVTLIKPTGGSCVFCFVTWAENHSELCTICKRPFLPGSMIEGFNDGRGKKGLVHASCGQTAAAYLGVWSEEGVIISS